MVVYGEYLFLENFITGFIIIFFTGKISGEKIKMWRLAVCAACSGAYAFIIFVPMPTVLSLLSKLVFAAAAVIIAFGVGKLKRVVVNGALFLAVTFLYGGITIALLIGFSWQGISTGGGIYMPGMTYFTVTCAATAAALFIWFIVSLIRVKRQAARTTVEAVIGIDGREWRLNGFVDTGNFLMEPVTGRPVAVIEKDVMEKILNEIEEARVRYTVIPYSAVGMKNGIMDGYRADYITIPGKTLNKPILAVCAGGEFAAQLGSGQIILPGGMLERGLYADID